MEYNIENTIDGSSSGNRLSDDYAVICNSSKEVLDSGSNMLQSAESTLNSLNECLKSVQNVTDSVCTSITAWKQIDKEMLEMDLHFKAFAKEMDKNLEVYKTRIPVIEKQLDAVNLNLGKILDAVLAMDAQTEAQIDMKMRMMERIDLFLNTISTTMMKLL